MKINSLLNPLCDAIDYNATDSPYSQHMIVPTSSHNDGRAILPGHSRTPDQYWYSRYESYCNKSPSAVSTITTNVSRTLNGSLELENSCPLGFSSNWPSSIGGGRRTPVHGHALPGQYHHCEHYDSVSSSSSQKLIDRRRPLRPKYEKEEMHFIWYHRIDLRQGWKEIHENFNCQFPNRQRRGFQGMQCKFYRFIKDKRLPSLRKQQKMQGGKFLRNGAALRFGAIEWADVWYPWMHEERKTLSIAGEA